MSDVKETLRILRELGAALWNVLVLHLFMQAVQKCNPERNPLKVNAEKSCRKNSLFANRTSHGRRSHVQQSDVFLKKHKRRKATRAVTGFNRRFFGTASERHDAEGPLAEKVALEIVGKASNGPI